MNLQVGEERALCTAEMEVEGEENEVVDIKVARPKDRAHMIYVHVYPRSEKYYRRDDDTE